MMVVVQLNKRRCLTGYGAGQKTHNIKAVQGKPTLPGHQPKNIKKNSPGSASDGELYFVTSLLFAANRWD